MRRALSRASPACVGILGGMGPRATVDLFQKLVDSTPAANDSEHIPVVVYSVPQIPDRTAAILHGGRSPLADLRRGIDTLNGAGASVIVIACNTAHDWFAELQESTDIPLLHIAHAVVEELRMLVAPRATVGILGTSGTVSSGLYSRELSRAGLGCISPSAARQEDVDRGISLVKAGRTAESAALFQGAIDDLDRRNVQAIVLACTEIPLAMGNCDIAVPAVDATAALARHCVRYCRDADAKIGGDPAARSAETEAAACDAGGRSGAC